MLLPTTDCQQMVFVKGLKVGESPAVELHLENQQGRPILHLVLYLAGLTLQYCPLSSVDTPNFPLLTAE